MTRPKLPTKIRMTKCWRRKRAQHSTGVEGGKGAPQVEGSDGMTCEGDVCEFVCEDMESECGNSESRLGE